jgi:hypothetical protein
LSHGGISTKASWTNVERKNHQRIELLLRQVHVNGFLDYPLKPVEIAPEKVARLLVRQATSILLTICIR